MPADTVSDPVKIHHSVLQRINGEIETVGVEPVPEKQRTTTPYRLFIVWSMASASATTPLVGALLFNIGLWYMLAAIALSWVLFFLPLGVASEMGRELPLPTLLMARRNFGWHATFLFSLLFTFVNMAWFGLNCAVGAQILASLSHSSVVPWYWLVGGLDIVLVVFGYKWLEYFYRYTALLLVLCYGALTAYLFLHFSLHVPRQTAPVEWGPAITTVAGFAILGWAYEVSTVSRFCRPAIDSPATGDQPARKAPPRLWYFLMPSLGIMLPVVLMGVMGAFSQEAIGTWNIATLGASISGWGAIAAFGATLGVLHTNAMNLYPSTVDLLVAMTTVRKPKKWEQPLSTVILGVMGTGLAQAGILNHAETFVSDVSYLLGPFMFVMVIDWLWGLRNKRNVESYFRKPRGFAEQWRLPAIISFAAGFVVSFWGTNFLPLWLTNDIPLAFTGSVVSGILYGAWLSVRGHVGMAPDAREGLAPEPAKAA
jgi:purine-cytosine permease-like protein